MGVVTYTTFVLLACEFTPSFLPCFGYWWYLAGPTVLLHRWQNASPLPLPMRGLDSRSKLVAILIELFAVLSKVVANMFTGSRPWLSHARSEGVDNGIIGDRRVDRAHQVHVGILEGGGHFDLRPRKSFSAFPNGVICVGLLIATSIGIPSRAACRAAGEQESISTIASSLYSLTLHCPRNWLFICIYRNGPQISTPYTLSR